MKRDLQFTKKLEAGFPLPPKSYYERTNDTIAFLQKKDDFHKEQKGRKGRALMLTAHIAGMACAVMVFLSACAFAAKPGLAAELPLINDMVYALSPTISVQGKPLDETACLIQSAAAAFAIGDYASADALFYQRGSWAEDENTYLAAKYLYYVLRSAELFAGNGANSEAISFSVTDAAAEQKAFRYETVVSLELRGKDGAVREELIYAKFIENMGGLYITSIGIESDGFREFSDKCRLYGIEGLRYENPINGIAFETEYLIFMAVHKSAAIPMEEKLRLLERLRASIEAAGLSTENEAVFLKAVEDERAAIQEQRTAEVTTVQALAAEVMYRYYLGRKSGEAQDFSDIMERNEGTDLFFYDAQLAVDLTLKGSFSKLDTVKKGAAEILEMIESNEDRLAARFYVWTEIAGGPMQGVGEEVILSFEKLGEGWIITGYDRTGGDGIYMAQLKPLSQKYKGQGLSWQEADKKAYQELMDQLN